MKLVPLYVNLKQEETMVTVQDRSIQRHLLFPRNKRGSSTDIKSQINRQRYKDTMNWILLLSSHFLLVTIALALPTDKDAKKKVPSEVLTTQNPIKVKPSVKPVEQPKTNKLSAKKRDIPEALVDQITDAEEVPEDIYGGKSAEEYAKALTLGTGQDSSRVENAILKAESYGDPASINEYRYYGGGDDRRKRTAIYDGLLQSPGLRPKRELQLTPDDILTALLALWEQRHYYNSPRGRWSDDDSSLDLSESEINDEPDDSDVEGEIFDNLDGPYEAYNRPFPYFGKLRQDKRFMVSRRRRSSFLGNPKLRVPLIRRAIL